MLNGPFIDPHSDTWKVVEKWVNERLVIARARIEGEAQPLRKAETAALRARIATYKEILLLASPPTPADASAADDPPPQY